MILFKSLKYVIIKQGNYYFLQKYSIIKIVVLLISYLYYITISKFIKANRYFAFLILMLPPLC